MKVNSETLVNLFAPLVEHLSSSPHGEFSRISAPEEAEPGSLVFAGNETFLKQALQRRPSGVVIPGDLTPLIASESYTGTVLTSPATQLSLARIASEFFPVEVEKAPFDGLAIHPSAVVSESAKIGNGVTLGPNVTIGPGSVIGDKVTIGAGTVVEANCTVKNDSYLRAKVFVGQGTLIGEACEIHPMSAIGTEGFGYAQDQTFTHHHIPHRGRVVLEDRVHVGAGVTIDRGTFGESRIGAGTIIDNQCHFGHNFVCGSKCIFTGGALVAGSVRMGDMCVVGGRTTISGHLSITSRVRLAGLSGVTKDIVQPGEYGGYPLQPLKDSLRSLSTLPHLPNMRKQLKSLSK